MDIVGTLRRNPAFARIFFAQLISFGGDWFLFVALQGTALELTGSSSIAGLLFTVQLLPQAFVSPIAGAIVDRLDRRMIMIAADGVRAVLALGFLLVHSRATLVIAFGCSALISVMTSFFEPASAAILPKVVREDDLPTAVTLHGTTWAIMLLVGAALGGVVAVAFGRKVAFLCDAASFAVSGLLLLSVRGRYKVARTTERRSLVADVRELITYARGEPRLTSMLTVKAGFGLTAGVIGLISVMSIDVFHAGDRGTGLMLSARGLGALIGPPLFRRIFGTSDRALFAGITTAFAVFGVGYGLFGAAPSLTFAAIGIGLAHVGGGSQWVLSTIGLQRFSRDDIRGRVFGADFSLLSVTMGISFAVTGILADVVGPRAVAIGLSTLGILWTLGWTLGTRHTWPPRGITTQIDTGPSPERLEV
jgi:MFS family permease